MNYYTSSEEQSSNYSIGAGPPSNNLGYSDAVFHINLQNSQEASGQQQHALNASQLQLQQSQQSFSFASSLPERPGEPDCVYYLRTGQCSYGMACRFNHPPNFTPLNRGGPLDYPERPGHPECQYFLKTGSCKFGSTCKFDHPKEKLGIDAATALLQQQQQLQLQLQLQQQQQQQAPITLTAQGAGAGEGVVHYISNVQVLTNPDSFPQRMGQPECPYYMKTGDCKYGITCKFHHPKDRANSSLSTLLSPMGFPLRPGVQACQFYIRYGTCKFGPTCKFDHPVLSTDYSQASGLQQEIQSSNYMNIPITVQYTLGVGGESVSEVHQTEALGSDNTPLSFDSTKHQTYPNASVQESPSS